MKTPWYRLTGRPLNADDCVDYIRRRQPERIRLDVQSSETIREWLRITRYTGRLTLAAGGGRRSCDFALGGHVSTCLAPPGDDAAVAGVRRRLDHLLARLQAAGTAVECPRRP
ncbi:MAG: hypothetical protein JW951_10490 [Lentisphaerae bacterium]|nr:hypothetical protein [Lentisphaerota bacterium]